MKPRSIDFLCMPLMAVVPVILVSDRELDNIFISEHNTVNVTKQGFEKIVFFFYLPFFCFLFCYFSVKEGF